MSGRGHGRRSRDQGQRGQGRDSQREQPISQPKAEKEPKFKGSSADLPCLNFGAPARDNKPIEFLKLVGEHVAKKYKPSLCQAFWSTPPAYGDEEEEPEMPADIPAGNLGKAILAQFLSDHKDWKSDARKILEHKQSVFALVYAQLSDSSRCEVQDDEL